MDQVKQVLESFNVNGPAFFASLVNFIVLLFILHRFAYKPLLQVLDDRRTKIAEAMKQAEQIKEELAKTQTAREEILFKTNENAQRMLDEAKAAAAQFRDQKLTEALQAAQDTMRKAQEAARLERDRLMGEFRKEMITLVLITTAKVTGKILTEADQKRLADETLKELAA